MRIVPRTKGDARVPSAPATCCRPAGGGSGACCSVRGDISVNSSSIEICAYDCFIFHIRDTIHSRDDSFPFDTWMGGLTATRGWHVGTVCSFIVAAPDDLLDTALGPHRASASSGAKLPPPLPPPPPPPPPALPAPPLLSTPCWRGARAGGGARGGGERGMGSGGSSSSWLGLGLG